MRVAIAGGGTGGHLFPGIAVAKELKGRLDDVSVLFIGTPRGIEANIVPQEGLDIEFIDSEGIVGRSFMEKVGSLLLLPSSIRDSRLILKQFRPDVVLGVGGYCSGPVLFTAAVMKIPTIIHEQNTIPGSANKILGRFVDIVAVTYLESVGFFPRGKTYLTGNPVRSEIVNGDRNRGYRIFSLEEGLFTIFIFGGSSGAHSINRAVGEALVYLEDFRGHIQFLHQTGEKDLQSVRECYQERGFKGTVIPFTHDMGDAYAVSDLVISRAGATTLAELTACGKAAILVPYPHAAGDHQKANAEKLWDVGAAQMIMDANLDGRSLSDMIKQVFNNPDTLSDMERVSRSIGRPDAVNKLIDLILGLARKKKDAGKETARSGK